MTYRYDFYSSLKELEIYGSKYLNDYINMVNLGFEISGMNNKDYHEAFDKLNSYNSEAAKRIMEITEPIRAAIKWNLEQ